MWQSVVSEKRKEVPFLTNATFNVVKKIPKKSFLYIKKESIGGYKKPLQKKFEKSLL